LTGEFSRRDFIKIAGATALILPIAGQLEALRALNVERASPEVLQEGVGKKWAMVLDLNKCIGCFSCVKACQQKNALPEDVELAHVYKLGERNGHTYFLPTLCMQCEHPACMSVCPTGATYKRKDGIVKVDVSRCIGCGMCVLACPYRARILHPFTGYAIKCDFCADRIEQGLKPACVEACPRGARIFGNISDPDSEVSRLIREKKDKIFVLLPELGLNPSVYYVKPEV